MLMFVIGMLGAFWAQAAMVTIVATDRIIPVAMEAFIFIKCYILEE